MKWWLLIPGLVAVVWGVLVLAGQLRWQALTDGLHAQLEAAREPPSPQRYDARELQGLPAPVQRYFRAVLKDGAPIVAAATLEHRGQFNMGESDDRWRPLTSRQRVVTRRPGFVWSGRVAMLPGVPVWVHDTYVAGLGSLHPALFGLFSLTRVESGGDLARDELMRFFAEAAWYPTAWLPSQGVQWQAVDDHTARATMRDGPHSVTLTFGFDAHDLLRTVRAEARGRMVAGRSVPTAWEGRWSDYRWQGGMQVPMTGEVAWLLPGAGPTGVTDKPYWRATLTAVHHEPAGDPGR